MAPAGTFQGRCGFGPRQPLLVISPWARQNYVDHTLTDQSSILRFIEDNWHLGRLCHQSTDAAAGSLRPMFDFNDSPSACAVPYSQFGDGQSVDVVGRGARRSRFAAGASSRGSCEQLMNASFAIDGAITRL
jgi:phospholipase C